MTPSEDVVASLNKTLQIVDRHGRKLTIRQINALDRLRLLKAAGPELSQNDSWLNMAALAVAVREINGVPRPTPTNERQIERTVQELDDHGLQAVSEALALNEEVMPFGSMEGNAEGTLT